MRRSLGPAALAMFVLALAAGVAAWRGGGELPVPPPAACGGSPGAAVAGVVDAAARAAGVAVPALPSAARLPAPSGRAAVHGTLRLADGEALAGQPVQLERIELPSVARLLQADRAPPWQRLQTVGTDAAGAFAFTDLDAGRYRVLGPEALALDPVECALAAGERRDVDFVVHGVLVTGNVVAGDAAAPFCRLQVLRGGRELRTARADAGGAFALALAPGPCEVRLFCDVWPVAPLAVHQLVVPDDVVRTTWRLAMGGTDLEVAVRDAEGNPAPSFTVRLDGTLADGERAVREFPGVAGRGIFEHIPAGVWTVALRSPDFVAPPPRELVTRAAIPRERLDFVVAPGVVVPLQLQRPDGSPLLVEPELLPWLRAGDVAVPCTALARNEPGEIPRRIGYVGVPPGRVVLDCVDRIGAAAVEFLPFEPVGVQQHDAVRGATVPIVVVATPRAAVDLRGCEAGGREDTTARVRVFAGEREVRGRPRQPPQRWLGWLPPGDYRVVVERAAGSRDHALRVDRGDVVLRLRP